MYAKETIVRSRGEGAVEWVRRRSGQASLKRWLSWDLRNQSGLTRSEGLIWALVVGRNISRHCCSNRLHNLTERGSHQEYFPCGKLHARHCKRWWRSTEELTQPGLGNSGNISRGFVTCTSQMIFMHIAQDHRAPEEEISPTPMPCSFCFLCIL